MFTFMEFSCWIFFCQRRTYCRHWSRTGVTWPNSALIVFPIAQIDQYLMAVQVLPKHTRGAQSARISASTL